MWLLPQEASEAGMQSQVAQLQQQRTQQSEQLSLTEQECSRLQQLLNAQAQVLPSILDEGSGPGLLTNGVSVCMSLVCAPSRYCDPGQACHLLQHSVRQVWRAEQEQGPA